MFLLQQLLKVAWELSKGPVILNWTVYTERWEKDRYSTWVTIAKKNNLCSGLGHSCFNSSNTGFTVRESGFTTNGFKNAFYFRIHKQCNLPTWTHMWTPQKQTRVPFLILTCSGNVADLFPTYPLTTWLWIDSTRHSIPATTQWCILHVGPAQAPLVWLSRGLQHRETRSRLHTAELPMRVLLLSRAEPSVL